MSEGLTPTDLTSFYLSSFIVPRNEHAVDLSGVALPVLSAVTTRSVTRLLGAWGP